MDFFVAAVYGFLCCCRLPVRRDKLKIHDSDNIVLNTIITELSITALYTLHLGTASISLNAQGLRKEPYKNTMVLFSALDQCLGHLEKLELSQGIRRRCFQ